MYVAQKVLFALVLFISGDKLQSLASENEVHVKQKSSILHSKNDFVDLSKSHGYAAEEHTVKTDDGYLLTLHRIPRGVKAQKNSKGVVFLLHGLLCSSVDWIILGPQSALAFLLAEEGYDVWLGNARGNTFSRRHVSRGVKSKAFWKFSWHEIGIYDLPAMIDYALNATRQTSLHYIGYSQGSTAFLVMASMRREYMKKVSMFQALGPAVYLSNTRSFVVRTLAPFTSQFQMLNSILGTTEFLPRGTLLDSASKLFCHLHSPIKILCSNILFLMAGFDSEQIDMKLLPTILAHSPAGASVNQIVHYLQCVKTGKFSLFDYGSSENMVKYNATTPPEYPIEQMTVPTVIHYGLNDVFCSVTDVQKLIQKLPNVVGNYSVPFAKFNHLDFIYAKRARELVYDRVIENLTNNLENNIES
uniref:Lipase n=1 Tax=Phlebotomus argentipes TaxID=94469 RepID=Q0ZST6_PHLAR|nr:44 kDa salivary lipase-like protein SP14 [Phlebotomus argentipes]